MYRKRTRHSNKLKNARAAKERKRLDGDTPEYPGELPHLRREIIVIDHDFGLVEHHVKLYQTNRIDTYRAECDGKDVGRMGWAKATEFVRKGFTRVGAWNR